MTKEYDDAVATLGGILRTPQELLPLGTEGRVAASSLAAQMEKTSAASTGFRWGWATVENPDNWSGAFYTRERVIEEARNEGCTTFYICGGRCPEASSYMPDADAIIDMIGQAASDDAGDAAEEFPDVTPESIVELDALLKEWSKKHLTKTTFWISEGEPEKIVLDEPVVEETP